MTTVSIIGAGRLGTTLGHALARKGYDLRFLTCRSLKSARESAAVAGRGRASRDNSRAAREADVVFLCVPDDALAEVARGLARSHVDWREKKVFHVSGLLPAQTLLPLSKKGALTASLHPVQSFPCKDADPGKFRGVFFGLEGEPAAVEAGRRIVRRLGGHSVYLSAEDKPLYHAACSLASNALTSTLAVAFALFKERGLGEEEACRILLPLVEGTLQNVKKLGVSKALTGPVVRGDIKTVAAHLRALHGHPGARDAYKSLGRITLDLARRKGVPQGLLKPLRKRLAGR